MEAVLKIAGVCLTALCASLLLKDRHSGAAILCTAAAVLIAALYCIGGAVGNTVSALKSMYSGTYFSEYAAVMLKALGIAYITSTASEMCTLAGEGSLARAVGLCGRGELLLLCLPLASELLSIAGDMLSGV